MEDIDNMNFEPDFDASDSQEMDDSSLNIDTNGDGIEDARMELNDTNGDGVADQYVYGQDTNGDGIIDTMNVQQDLDNNGTLETSFHIEDTDADGNPNLVIEEHDDEIGMHHVDVVVDTNNDGNPDEAASFVEADLNSNGVYDTVEVKVDENADGAFDSDELYAINEQTGVLETINPDAIDHEDYTTTPPEGYPDIVPNFDPADSDSPQVSGDPASDMDNWEYQGDTMRCALYSQKFVIEELTGQEVDIDQIADMAEDNGWFDEQTGTPCYALNKVLDVYGVDNQMTYNNDISDIKESLDNGNKVIVSLNCEQIWGMTDDNVYAPMPEADHAVEVIGIDYSTPEPMVILNDSGIPDGCGEMVPLSTFEESWATSGDFMITCYA